MSQEHETSDGCTNGPGAGRAATLWLLSELYYPEETSTGYFVTRIAEGLAVNFNVGVLCAQPTYSQRGVRAPRYEERSGVKIWRCWGTTLDKNVLALRVTNTLSISGGIFLSALRRVRPADIVLAVTNPPNLPLLAALVARAKHAKLVVLVHDVYPDALVRVGALRQGGLVEEVLRSVIGWVHRGATSTIVLGRDMKDLVVRRFGVPLENVAIIPNWADCDEIIPTDRKTNPLLLSLGIANGFVVQWAGNMGRTHDLQCLVAAIEMLRDHRRIHFLLAGWGARSEWLEEERVRKGLHNVTIIPNQPREGLQLLLNACDVSAISFIPGMEGISVPSRMYNAFAAGKPIIAVADDLSELGRVVREADVGWVVPPGSASELSRVIVFASENPEEVRAKGQRARLLVEREYTFQRVTERYRLLLKRIVAM